jgi:hypothetical protein
VFVFGKGIVMDKKVFLLGRAGSGKSSVAQLILQIFQTLGDWNIYHIYDYEYLERMFLIERVKGVSPKKRMFRPEGPKGRHGFDVVNFSVLDIVLNRIGDDIRNLQLASPGTRNLFLVEFARNDYSHALQIFGQDLLQDAHLLYLKAEVEICIDRIHRRIDCPPGSFNHFVSDEIMRRYYSKDDWTETWLDQFLSLPQHKGLSLNANIIENQGSTEVLSGQVEKFVSSCLIPELALV